MQIIIELFLKQREFVCLIEIYVKFGQLDTLCLSTLPCPGVKDGETFVNLQTYLALCANIVS